MASITTKERTSPKGITSYQVQVRGKGVDKPYSKTFPTSQEAQEWAALQDAKLNHGEIDDSQSTDAATQNLASNTPASSTESAYSIANIVDEYLRDTQFKGGIKKKGYADLLPVD